MSVCVCDLATCVCVNLCVSVNVITNARVPRQAEERVRLARASGAIGDDVCREALKNCSNSHFYSNSLRNVMPSIFDARDKQHRIFVQER